MLKRFVSQFTGSFCFYLYLILHACTTRFDVTENLERFWGFGESKQDPC
jgi:hypothetical protein